MSTEAHPQPFHQVPTDKLGICTYVKMPWRDRYSVFAKQTTFHGFLELHESGTWWGKCLWIIIMGTCTGMLAWFIQIQISQYFNGPTATRVTPLGGPPVFPPVWVGHLKWPWIDAEKLNQFRITQEEMQVAMGYLDGGLVYNSTVPMEMAKKSLWEKMRQHNISNILRFYHHIALDVFDGSNATDLVIETRHAGNATFYLVNTSASFKVPLSIVWMFKFNFNFSTFWSNARRLVSFLPNGSIRHDPKMLHPFLFNSDTYMTISLEPEVASMINTESSIYRLMGRCTSDHPKQNWYSPWTIQLNCEIRANSSVNATTCLRYDVANSYGLEYTESFLNGHVSLCHHGMINASTGQLEGKEDLVFRDLASHERDARNKKLAACREEFIPKCDNWRTTWSLTNLKYDFAPAEAASVSIVFPDSTTLLLVEEIRQYEWHDLVSDFGGLLGLWLGASMMSLFQLIHLCFFSESKKKQPDAVPDAMQKFEDSGLNS